MAVNTYHPQFLYYSDDWQTCRDARTGEKAIKEAGQRYVPKLGAQTDADYLAYLARGSFYGATGRTVDGLTGMLFRKKIIREGMTESLEKFSKDITNTNTDLSVFATTCVDEALTLSRGGILVDYSDDTAGMTVAQVEEFGSRPFMTLYKANQIINWQTKHIKGYGLVLSRVVLKETYEYTEPGDEYTVKQTFQYRDLYLDENGLYTQRLFREASPDSKGLDVPVDESTPVMNGERIDFIPFVFFNDVDNKPDVRPPALYNMAMLNVHHFQVDVDRAYGLHYTAMPTPYLFGVTQMEAEEGAFMIGPGQCLRSTNADAKTGFLQVNAQNFDVLYTRQKHFEEQMARLGARMLSPERADAEAAETVAIRNQGEFGVLVRVAHSVSMAITTAMKWCAMWIGEDADKVSVRLSTDFNTKQLDANMLTALVQALQGGQISKEVFFYNLQQGEIIPDSRTFDEEIDSIDTDGGGLMNTITARGGMNDAIRPRDDINQESSV